VSTPD